MADKRKETQPTWLDLKVQHEMLVGKGRMPVIERIIEQELAESGELDALLDGNAINLDADLSDQILGEIGAA
jgi:hypothetical protein